MGNRIEVAKSGRSKCVTCNEAILKGTPRLSEEYNDIGIPDLIHRFYHLRCAAAVHPEVVAAALAHVDHGVEFDRAEIEAKIAPAVARAAEQRKQKYLAQQAEKDAKTKAVIVEADEQTTELLAQLDGNPEDPGTLAVVADQLQARGDIRGELIALQLAAPSASAVELVGDDDEETDASERTRDAQRRSVRIAELIEKLTVPVDPQDKVVWGVGFIRRLELQHKNGTRLAALAPIWKHPSLRFLSELCVTFASNLDTSFIARMHELVPKTLRRLELGDDPAHALADAPALVAQLPLLEFLGITGKAYTSKKVPLAHPRLRSLCINVPAKRSTGDLNNLLPFLMPKHLPALTEMWISPSASVVDEMTRRDTLAYAATSLGATKWFNKLQTFGWIHAEDPIDATDVDALTLALGKKKLAKLDFRGTHIPLALRDKLAKLCTELVAPLIDVASDQTVFIEHANKPEWGRGKLVRKKDGKVEVQFPKPVGLKVFKADAPFLKMLA